MYKFFLRFVGNWSVNTRLKVGFGLTLLLIALIAALGIVALERTRSSQQALDEATRLQQQADRLSHLLSLDLTRSQAIARSAGMPEVADYFQPQIQASEQEFAHLLDALQGARHPTIAQAAQELAKQRQHYMQARQTVLSLVETGQTIQATEQEKSLLLPAAQALSAQARTLADTAGQGAQHAQRGVAAMTSGAQTLILALSLLAMCVGASFAWIIGRSIAKPAIIAMRVSEAIANGNLAHPVPEPESLDELGRLLQSMQRMRAGLIQLTTEVKLQSEQVATTSTQVAADSQVLASHSQTHAATLSESRSALQTIGSEIQHNQAQTRQAASLTVSALTAANKGAQSMVQAVSTMQGIHESSRRVADIIGVIDGIAFQTNILALNAAVEAARAGDQGRGFAVVASEVRSLAQRSANAAREIKQLITESVTRVEEGFHLVNDTGNLIRELQGAIDQVSQLMASLHATSARHATDIGQVHETVHQLDESTQANVALMSQNSAAALHLQEQATKLLDAVSVFELTPHGGTR